MTPMKTTAKIIIILAVVASGAAAAAWLLPHTSKAGVAGYRVSPVVRGEIVQTVTATGVLNPLRTVAVGSQVSGTIEKLYVDFNDAVTEGQLLMEIEPSTFEARVAQAEADLDSANATLELRQVSARRASELLAGKLVSQADYDQAMAELRQQQAAVRIKESSLKSARVDLERTKISSPVNGVVIARKIDVGQTVQASFSAPELFTIAENLRRMEISASVSEADIGGVVSGQPVEFTVDAFRDRVFSGTVRQVRANAATSSNVVTYPTIITVANDDLKLLPGMTASVTITTAKRQDILRVPNAALRFTPPTGAEIAGGATEDGAMPSGAQPPVVASGTPPAMTAGAPGGPGSEGATVPAAAGSLVKSASTRTVYVLANPPERGSAGTGALVARTVQTGVTDGAFTEIVSGLSQGEAAVTGTLSSDALAAASSNGTRNPFMPTPPKSAGKNSGPPPPPM
jgi:HlyD family secretion protein